MWTEILSHIPDEVLLRPGVRILNVACGHGTPAIVIAKRMLALGVAKSDVQDSIWLLDKYYVFTNPAKKVLGFTNVVTADFLQWETDMKFDAVIGNPPYSNGLWRQFIEKSYTLSNQHIVMIAPDGANPYATRGETIQKQMLENGIQGFEDVTEHFPTVSSGKIVCYFFDKNKDSNPKAFEQNDIQHVIARKVISASDKLVAQIGNQSKDFIDFPRTATPTQSSVKMLESISKDEVVYSNIENRFAVFNGADFWFTTRFFGQSESSPIVEITDDVSISHRIVAIKKFGPLEGFKQVYLSKLFRFVVAVVKGSKFDTPMALLKSLPKLDLTRTWTDAELYAHFNLTQEEIDYIESVVK